MFKGSSYISSALTFLQIYLKYILDSFGSAIFVNEANKNRKNNQCKQG